MEESDSIRWGILIPTSTKVPIPYGHFSIRAARFCTAVLIVGEDSRKCRQVHRVPSSSPFPWQIQTAV